MQSVADRWYILYSRIATACALLFVGGAVTTWFLPQYKPLGHTLGLGYTIFGLAVVQVMYVLFFYKPLSNRYGLWQATLLLACTNALGTLSLMQSTGTLQSYYLGLWAVLVLVSGMFGTYAIAGADFAMIAYFMLVSAGTSDQQHRFTILSAIAPVATITLGLVSHYLWRHRYVNAESQQLAQLSGMVKSKEQQAAILIESLSDGVIVVNTEGKITLMNQAASTLTEWPTDEALGIDAALVVKLQQENGAELAPDTSPLPTVLEKKTAQSATLQLVGRNNKQTIVSVVVSPIILPKTQDLTGAVALLRDISVAHREERKRADFISTASHEMRTPVAAIEGYLALALNEKVSKIDPKARSYLEKAHESTQHLGKLFQDLLTSAKAEDGRLVSHPVVVEMGAYLEQLIDTFRFTAQKKGLLADFVIGASASVNGTPGGNEKVVRPLYYVHLDPDRFREVITNLFDNAVKYTPSGKVSIGLTGNTEVVQLYVRDTGPGIPPEDIPHLFQKFYRVDSTATRTIGGTGLGLFICRKIVELYKGKIWVESEIGKGSAFYINLPRLSTQKAGELQTAEAQNLAPAPVTSLTTPV